MLKQKLKINVTSKHSIELYICKGKDIFYFSELSFFKMLGSYKSKRCSDNVTVFLHVAQMLRNLGLL